MSQLAPQGPRGLAVERPSDLEPAAHDRSRRHEPPRGAVELDLDASAWPLVQGGDDHLYESVSASAPTPAATAAATAAAFAAFVVPPPFPEPPFSDIASCSSATGSSRAETT